MNIGTKKPRYKAEKRKDFRSIKMDERLYHKLKKLAKSEGKQIGFVFDRAMKNYLKLRKVM